MMDPIKKRGQIKAKLTRFETYLNQLKIHVDNNMPLSVEDLTRLRMQVSTVEPLLNLFCDIQDQIENNSDNLENEYGETANFEERYFKLMSIANVYLSNSDESKAIVSREANAIKVAIFGLEIAIVQI
ncbi:hypothetical protein RN001_002639 [Aquatica leii]|uniref:Uncharacterized protein n=1 Tax=Aquatica leii TaxID=1421715 RepID=A0AAN7QNM2_9COLE|nr:hypothetical protein RN001_002639 [Aquatica leii]